MFKPRAYTHTYKKSDAEDEAKMMMKKKENKRNEWTIAGANVVTEWKVVMTSPYIDHIL